MKMHIHLLKKHNEAVVARHEKVFKLSRSLNHKVATFPHVLDNVHNRIRVIKVGTRVQVAIQSDKRSGAPDTSTAVRDDGTRAGANQLAHRPAEFEQLVCCFWDTVVWPGGVPIDAAGQSVSIAQ